MQKKSITKNYVYNLLYQVLTLILPLVTAPYISRVLGAENIGIYSYTISIVTYFITFGSLGIALYGQREIAYVQNDKEKYSKIFWEIILLRLITLSCSLLLFYFIFVFRNNQYHIYYTILILEIFANFLDVSWFFKGIEEFKKNVMRHFIVKVISLILIFIFVKTKNDLKIYFIIYVLSTLIGNFSLLLYLPKYLVKIKLKDLNVLRHLKPTIVLFIPQIAIQVYALLDKTMIGAIIMDKKEVGYYEQSQKIIKMLLTIITSLGAVMMPRIAYTYANGNREKIKQYMLKSFNLVFFLSFPMILGIISVNTRFVPLFFGKGYDKVVLLMNIISPILLLIGLSNVTGIQYLLPTKRQKEYTISVIVGAVVNFIFNMLLIPKYGAIGASFGTLIAEFLVSMVQIYYVRCDFELKDIVKLSKNYILASLLMFFCCFILRNMPINDVLVLLVQVITGIVTYGVCLILLKDKFTLEIINKFINKIRRI